VCVTDYYVSYVISLYRYLANILYRVAYDNFTVTEHDGDDVDDDNITSEPVLHGCHDALDGL